uniref:Fork-head domain-containing protein n=1 Tax=Scophthalmus maximus TaxID=52904 RepID=A0A8D2ZZW6_SCOMX
MTLQLRTRAQLFHLHCCVGLTDWDMDKELKLATTTDQFYHDDNLNDQYVVQRPSARASRRKDEFIWYDKTSGESMKPCPVFCLWRRPMGELLQRMPNLWLLVNPDIACPIQYGQDAADLRSPCEPAEEIQTRLLLKPAETKRPGAAELSAGYMIKNEDVSCRPAKNRRKGRTTKVRVRMPGPALVQDSKSLKPGCWPRPPVNYCILIALALKSSHSGSLKVQQIYNFTREHFPFFQTAPDGWKNTIRHNLCFSNSFRKTCNQLCRDGKRKSCFWHLTLDGQRRLKDELRSLTGEAFKQLERSIKTLIPAELH